MAHLKFSIFASLLLIALNIAHAQTITTANPGPWNVGATWTGGVIPTVANSTSVVINHAVTIPNGANIVIDEVAVSTGIALTVQSGGTLDLRTATNPVLTVSGTLTANSGAIILTNQVNAANVVFAAGSTYIHQQPMNAVVPFATWNATSLFQITGFTANQTISSPSWSQSFGNIEYNCTAQSGTANFVGLLNNVQGNLRIVSTAGSNIQLNSGTGAKTINIGGNLSVEGSSRIVFTTDGNLTVNITGNLSIISTSTALQQVAGAAPSAGTCAITATNFTLNIPAVASFRLSAGASGGNGTVNVRGNFDFQSGIVDENSTTGRGAINFIGNGVQTLTRGGTSDFPVASTIDYSVSGTSTLDLNTGIIRGQGNFVVANGGGVRFGALDATGAYQTGTTAGNVRVSGTRSFGLGTTIEYNGAGAQFIALSHPNGSTISTRINNTSGVSLAGNVTIGGALTLQSGNLNVTAGRVLTLGSTITPNANFITVASTSDLILNGAAVSGTFPFPAGAQTFNSLTVNRAGGGVTFANDVILSNTVLLTAGTLNFNSHSLTLNGTFNAVAGSLSSNATSVLNVGGSGNLGTLVFASGSELNSMTINRLSAGSVTLDCSTVGGDVTIANNLNLSQGDFINDNGLIMSNNSNINRNVLARFLGNRPVVTPGDRYNVTYTGVNPIDTGSELPESTSPDDLNNLTINGGPVTLLQDVTINGDMTLSSESLIADATVITMRGANWFDNAGDFTPGSGVVVFSGSTTVSGSSTPQFGGMELGSAATLIFPNGNVNVSGDMNFLTGGTFVPNFSNTVLNGSVLQFINVNGATFPDMTVSKSGASDVALLSTMNLTGTLNIQSGSDFSSDGNLILRSTSDGIFGNANIAPLLSGADVLGDVIVQRFMSGEGRIYRYISSAVTNANVEMIRAYFPVTGNFDDPSTGPGLIPTNASMYYYDETAAGGLQAGYIAYPNSGIAADNPLTPALGYAAFIREANASTTWEVVGPINKMAVDFNVTFNDTNDALADGWNLVGNPYPSAIDWNAAGWTKTNISPSIAVRDNGIGGGGFRYWDGVVGGFNAGLISTGQGFWVRATATNPSLIITETAKTQSGAVLYREKNEEPDYFSLKISNALFNDETYVRVREGALATLDPFDAPKMANDNINLSTITQDGITAAINALNVIPCSAMKIDLAFTKGTNGKILPKLIGTYKIDITRVGKFTRGAFNLRDKFTNTTTQLNGTSYSFQVTSAAASYAADRFELVFDEGDMQLNEPVIYSNNACEGKEVSILLDNSIDEYTYFVTRNDIRVSNEVTGTGDEIAFNLQADALSNGDNELVIHVQGFCKTESLANTATITVNSAPTFTVGDIRACNTGESTFTVNGGVDGTYYQWYKAVDAQEAIAITQSNQFTATDLKYTKSFYVEAVSPFGCVSERKAATVNVVYFDEVVINETTSGLLESSYETGNQWFFENEMIEGATQQVLRAEESGTYKVEVSINGCVAGAEIEEIITGIEEQDNGVSVYPNIVHAELFVKGGYLSDNKATILVYDINGRLMSRHEVDNAKAGFLTTVDFRTFAIGAYVVKIRNGHKVYEVKIIKQ